ncbi:hypothetical protein AB0B28_20910 [Glycomyces sp. NPDC046736]|uniref:hypothetical protein n=1 Tax=Glycomyces sp. NPDC046736 TaxID=3155615 RepID=UPI0033C1404F
MTAFPVPHSTSIPPGTELVPPPGVGMGYRPEDARPPASEEEGQLMDQRTWAKGDAEADRHTEDADRHQSTAELQDEAEHTRERLNSTVLELRERLGMDPDAEHAHGLFAPVRRHPFTVAVAAAGAATAAVVGVAISHGHRKEAKRSARESARHATNDALMAASQSGKAARRRMNTAFNSAANRMRRKRNTKGLTKRLRRLTHR